MYNLSEIAKLLKAEIISSNENIDKFIVNDILLDSRKLLTPENTIFVALKTDRNNGHRFIEKLYQKNVRLFLISEFYEEFVTYTDAVFLLVNNTLDSLQRLVAWHRSHFDIPVIGITGSNGKTIVKEWLFQLLYQDKKIVRSPKSYNSQIGVPLSVWQLKSDDQLAIFEAGISEPNEMDKLQKIIKPTIGVFTNIGTAHDEMFINSAQKAGEKLRLFTSVDLLIYCTDYTEITQRFISSGLQQKIKSYTWGHKNDPDLLIIKIEKQQKISIVTAKDLQGKKFEITIPFIDDASIENAIQCWCVMRCLDYSHEIICKRMLSLLPIGMRLEMKDGINACSIIDDSYNSDVNSLRIALDFMLHQRHLRKRTVILSDILQSGRDEKELYNEIAELMKLKNIDRIIGIGTAISKQADCFKIEKYFYSSLQEFIQQFDFSNFESEIILLKGARMFHFETISKLLQQKSHETVLEVNLSALIHNVNYYKSLLKPDVKIMAMVKAFSYGSGSFEIANILQFHHIDYLAVAYVDEGVELRKAGITLPMMVMHPEPNSYDTMIKYNLEPEISSFRMLDMLEEALATSENTSPVGIHIKIDTGMHRLGFQKEDLKKLVGRIQGMQEQIFICSVFSHLASSDLPENDDFTNKQINKLIETSDFIKTYFNYPILVHILNSAGISRFPDAQLNMVRLGIGMYGVPVCKSEENALQNVCTLRTSLSQIKNIAAGDTVGYNLQWKAEKDTPIGVIPIGYADGLHRAYGNSVGKVLIKGKLAPIIGVVCMDMCMIDLTGIDAIEGDSVIIFGNDYSIKNVSNALGTISYEVLTGISRRVKRVYYQE